MMKINQMFTKLTSNKQYVRSAVFALLVGVGCAYGWHESVQNTAIETLQILSDTLESRITAVELALRY